MIARPARPKSIAASGPLVETPSRRQLGAAVGPVVGKVLVAAAAVVVTGQDSAQVGFVNVSLFNIASLRARARHDGSARERGSLGRDLECGHGVF